MKYIEIPDRDGNVGYLIGGVFDATPCIIEAIQTDQWTLQVIAPQEMKDKWSRVNIGSFIRVDDSLVAEKISFERHEELYLNAAGIEAGEK